MTEISIRCSVNGKTEQVTAKPAERLLDVLRVRLGLTGTKEGCGEGECGACAVLIDGELAFSCLVPAMHADGTKIETIENLGTEKMHPIQQAFLECGGAQCGICTPGMIMATAALLKKNPTPSEEEIREGLSGNLCRCTGYTKIFDAVRQASQQ